MSKFTQGKWRCDYEDGKYIWGAGDEVIGELYFTTPEETKANARLIAAAPEMYEQLKLYAGNPFFNDKDARELLARIDVD